MLARIQQLIVFIVVVIVTGCAILAFRLGYPAWALAAPALIVVCYVAVLGLEFFWVRASYAADCPDRPSIGQLMAAWRDESLIAPRVFLWRQPLRSAAIPDCLPSGAQGRRGVVLVHGFVCNRGLWNPWMKNLRSRGIPFVAVTLEPTFGSIDRYREAIEAAVAQLQVATEVAPVLVGHSMGGLAIRAWLALGGKDRRHYRVVTIASPHRGTRLARHAFSVNGHEMRVESPWLVALARGEAEDAHEHFTCFWGHCDNIVYPTRGATLPGADNRHLPRTPHVAMAYHPAVFEAVLRIVEAKVG